MITLLPFRRPPAFRLVFIVALFLAQKMVTPSYGQSASPAYIFYWGDIQCRLTAENSYHGRIEVSPAVFRQSLFSTPYLWNGAALLDSIGFLFEGREIGAQRRSRQYLENFPWLDTLYGETCKGGETFRFTGLPLDQGRTGAIDLAIVAGAHATPATVSYIQTASTTRQERRLKSLRWGPYIQLDRERDFLSPAEFWETIREAPALEWMDGQDAQAVKAMVTFNNFAGRPMGFGSEIGFANYSSWMELLQNFRHLIRPGDDIGLSILPDGEDGFVYQTNVQIVAEGDPRHRLRRETDGHVLKMEWAGWEHTSPPLYLREIRAGSGKSQSADLPRFFRAAFSSGEARLERLLTSRPKFWVDGKRLTNLAFTLVYERKRFDVEPGQPLPIDSIQAALEKDPTMLISLKLDSLRMEGFDLRPVEYNLTAWASMDLPFPNQLEALEAAPAGGPAWLAPPRIDRLTQDLIFSFDLPETAYALLSVYDKEGANIFINDGRFGPGSTEVRMLRRLVRNPGLHQIFLITSWGVAKETIEIK